MNFLQKVKLFFSQNKISLFAFVLGLVVLFAFKEKLEVFFTPSNKYDAIRPVDRSIERDRLTCYQNRIPKEVIDFCDSEIEK